MINTHVILGLLVLIIAASIILIYFLRVNVNKARRRMELLDNQQKKDHAEKYVNIFELLKLVGNNLEASKVSLQHITPKIKVNIIKNSGLSSRVESSAAKDTLVKSKKFVLGDYMAEESAVEKIGVVDETTDSNIFQHKIAKATENIHGLNDALRRLLAAKERVRTEVPSLAMDDFSGLSSFRPYLPFILGGERYAVSIATVVEVLHATKLFVDPGVPDKIRSAIKLDGTVVPVIDLSNHFRGEKTKIGRNTLIVILLLRSDSEVQKVGIKADGVGNLIMVDQANILPTRAKADRARNDFAQGEYKTENDYVTILDLNNWLRFNHAPGLSSRDENLPGP